VKTNSGNLGATAWHCVSYHQVAAPVIIGKPDRFVLKPTFPRTAFGRSRPAADAAREAVERWLFDGLDVTGWNFNTNSWLTMWGLRVRPEVP
jgi:hypothetical protein